MITKEQHKSYTADKVQYHNDIAKLFYKCWKCRGEIKGEYYVLGNYRFNPENEYDTRSILFCKECFQEIAGNEYLFENEPSPNNTEHWLTNEEFNRLKYLMYIETINGINVVKSECSFYLMPPRRTLNDPLRCYGPLDSLKTARNTFILIVT